MRNKIKLYKGDRTSYQEFLESTLGNFVSNYFEWNRAGIEDHANGISVEDDWLEFDADYEIVIVKKRRSF